MSDYSGLFLPTTFPIVTEDYKELGVRLYQDLAFICRVVNLKDSGYYSLTPFVTGQVYFPNPALTSTTAQTPSWRGTIREVINFGALPNNATKSVAHNLPVTNQWSYTRIYATATDQTNLIGITVPDSQITIDATNVNITTTVNMSSYNICYIVVEFLDQ